MSRIRNMSRRTSLGVLDRRMACSSSLFTTGKVLMNEVSIIDNLTFQYVFIASLNCQMRRPAASYWDVVVLRKDFINLLDDNERLQICLHACVTIDFPLEWVQGHVSVCDVNPVECIQLIFRHVDLNIITHALGHQSDYRWATVEVDSDRDVCGSQLLVLTRLQTLDVPPLIQHLHSLVLRQSYSEVTIALTIVLSFFS